MIHPEPPKGYAVCASSKGFFILLDGIATGVCRESEADARVRAADLAKLNKAPYSLRSFTFVPEAKKKAPPKRAPRKGKK